MKLSYNNHCLFRVTCYTGIIDLMNELFGWYEYMSRAVGIKGRGIEMCSVLVERAEGIIIIKNKRKSGAEEKKRRSYETNCTFRGCIVSRMF